MSTTVLTAAKIRRNGSLVAHLVTETGRAFSLHYTPETADFTGGGNNYASVARQGLTPLVRFQDSKVRQMSFTTVLTPAIGVAAPGPKTPKNSSTLIGLPTATSVRLALHDLMVLADQVQKLRLINVTAGIETAGWWRVTDLTVKITERDTNQQVKSAELNWTLLEANDDRPKIGRPPPPPPPPKRKPKAKRKPGAPTPHFQADYTVKKGDSLWSIAARLLGNGTRWKEIYEANVKRLHLAPPVVYNRLLTVWIYPNQVLKIPAR